MKKRTPLLFLAILFFTLACVFVVLFLHQLHDQFMSQQVFHWTENMNIFLSIANVFIVSGVVTFTTREFDRAKGLPITAELLREGLRFRILSRSYINISEKKDGEDNQQYVHLLLVENLENRSESSPIYAEKTGFIRLENDQVDDSSIFNNLQNMDKNVTFVFSEGKVRRVESFKKTA